MYMDLVAFEYFENFGIGNKLFLYSKTKYLQNTREYTQPQQT